MNLKLSQAGLHLVLISVVLSSLILSFSTPVTQAQTGLSFTPLSVGNGDCEPTKGAFAYSWSGVSGVYQWTAPGGREWVCAGWFVVFQITGLQAGDQLKVCTSGDLPSSAWYDVPGPVFFFPRGVDVTLSTEGSEHCYQDRYTGTNGQIAIGHSYGWSERRLCNGVPDCGAFSAHTFSYAVRIAAVNGVPVASSSAPPTKTPVRPPPYSSSYYIGLVDFSQSPPTLNTSALYDLGRTEAISETVRGVTNAIVVLHFGFPRSMPQSLGGGFGTRLLLLYPPGEYLANTSTIAKGGLNFVNGFCNNSSGNMGLTLALGVNDSVQGIAPDHGRAWAEMIEAVAKTIRNDNTLCRPPGSTVSRVSIAGAIDIEPTSLINQSISRDVIQWAEAYSNTTRLPYYNFGTCSNCPSDPPEQLHTLPAISPLMDDVWTVSWGIPNAFPLPQIYNVNKLNASQWYNLNGYAATCASPCRPAQRPMYFRGTMTQRQRCDSPPNPRGCITADNKPEEGWQQLFEALNFTPALRQSRLRWSTDIKWEK